MNEAKSIYVGNAKSIGKDGFSIELNLSQLKAFLESAESKEHVRTYNGKDGENRTLKLVAWPLKEPQQYRTHSLKVDTWKPNSNQQTQQPAQNAGNGPGNIDVLPFN